MEGGRVLLFAILILASPPLPPFLPSPPRQAESDHPVWFMYLQDAVRLATGEHISQGSKHLNKRPSVTSANMDLEDLRRDALGPLSISEDDRRSTSSAQIVSASDAPSGSANAQLNESTDEVFTTAPSTPMAADGED